MTRRFELVEGGSSKFWEITLQGASFSVRYGRIGSAGQAQQKDFAGEAQAAAAAAKLVSEKTSKGYKEVTSALPSEAPVHEPDPEQQPAPKADEKAEAAVKTEKVAKKPAKVAKPEKKEIPALVVGSKSLGARALVNAAERFSSATTPEAWRDASGKISYSDYEVAKVLLHLLTHGLFAPTQRVHVRACRAALVAAPPEVALPILSALDEALVETVRTEQPILTSYVSVISRLERLAPDALRSTPLPPTLARVACLVRAFAGESLSPEEGASAVAAAAEMLIYGETAIVVADADDATQPVAPSVLGAALARIGGPHWIRTFPKPESLPASVAAPALANESLEEVGRVLSLFNKSILNERCEPPQRFFEVAQTLPEQKATFMRAAGIRKAQTPDEIPVGGEDLLEPMDVYDDHGFARLGSARLDAWAERWLSKFPEALTVRDGANEAYSIGAGLHHLVFLGTPFSEPMRRRLIGLPQPYEHNPNVLDVREYVERIRLIRPEGARALLPLLARMAGEQAEGSEEARALRLSVAAAVRALPEGEAIPEEYDALLSLGDATDYDAERIVREAVLALPAARGERVVAQTAHLLKDPFEELTYAREGASDLAMRRLARLVAAGRENPTMWHNVRSLKVLGAAFGPILAQALATETLSASFFERIEHALDPEAFTTVRASVGEKALDLAAEMHKLAKELGGKTTTVYVLSPGTKASDLSRVGGTPAGFEAADVPRQRGRKLVHAFTVDLNSVPELAARYPGARTLSFWIQGYSESETRAQAVIPRTEEQRGKVAEAGGSPLELLRLEVPSALFEDDVSDRAAYARNLLYQKAGFLLGGPIWLQQGRRGLDPTFLAQFDERLAAGANFGDMGICYSFADRALWQCH